MSDPYRISARFYDNLFESMNKGLRVLGLRLYLPKSGEAILDVGCGTGTHLAMYQRFKARLAGIDASPAMLAIARARLGQGADLQHGDAADMPFANGSFGLVLAMLSLHEMASPTRERVMRQMVRVMKPGGRLLLIDYHPGRLEFPQGWWTKAIILLSELAAGRAHFRNFRRYMRAGGLPAVIEQSGLSIEKQRIVGGGPLGLFLVRTTSTS